MIKLRLATIKDLDLLRYWDTKQHVIDCDPDDSWNWAIELIRILNWREQLIAEMEKEPIGMVQIIDPYEEESHYWGDVEPNMRAVDIWIGEEEYLNRGYGTQIMNLAIQRCFGNPQVKSILVDPLKSNYGAHRFYEGLGFKFVAERKFDGVDCFVYELKKTNVQNKNSSR